MEADVGLRYEGVFLPPPALPGKNPDLQPVGLTGVLNLGLAGGLEVDSGVFLGRVAAM